MPWYYGASDGWLMPLTMAVAMVLFWGGLIAVVVLVLRHFRTGPPRQSDAERVLAERLARGEIDETEYAKLRELLRAS